MKPVETGVASDAEVSDAHRLVAAASFTGAPELVNPYRFRLPLAPLAAAQAEGRAIDLVVIVRAFDKLAKQCGFLFVEGVGGVRVPLGPKTDVLDLIEALRLPVLVVGRAALGGINHALLTLEALRARGLRIHAIILNQPVAPASSPHASQEATSTAQVLAERTGVPVFGPLPYDPDLERNWGERIEVLATDPTIGRLAALLTNTA
jgi:dethiobiotin synthetase